MFGVLLIASTYALAQGTEDYDVLVRQGNSQLQAGSNEEALSTATMAIKVNSSRWAAYAVAGGALLNLKRYEEAADEFSRAIEHAPEAKQQGLRALRKQCLAAEMGTSAMAQSAPPKQPPTTTPTQAEIVLWKTIESTSNLADFQSYLTEYPHGAFAVLAHRQLDGSLTWTDPVTNLMWAREDNGRDVDWQRAKDTCTTSHLSGYTDWRLPTIEELASILDQTQNTRGRHIKGGILMTGWWGWSSTPGDRAGQAWNLMFQDGDRLSDQISDSDGMRAICVRHS